MENGFSSAIWSMKNSVVVGVLLVLAVIPTCLSSNCDLPCTACESDKCTKCSDDYFVYEDVCVKLCIQTTTSQYTTITPSFTTTNVTVTPTRAACLQDCPTDYFQNGSICETCHAECNACTGPLASDCVACRNYNATTAGECVSSCSLDTYEDEENKLCLPCHVECTTLGCTGPDLDDCLIATTTVNATTVEPGESDPATLFIIIGGVVGGALVIAIIIAIICCCRRHRGSEGPSDTESVKEKSQDEDFTSDVGSDGEQNPGCDLSGGIYGNVDGMGNLINIPADQTTQEVLQSARHNERAQNNNMKYQNGARTGTVMTDDEYVDPNLPQTVIGGFGYGEEYVAPDVQQQWGEEYTALDQNTVATPSDDTHEPASFSGSEDQGEIYQNIVPGAQEHSTPPPPISPRHASLFVSKGSPEKKAKIAPGFSDLNEDEILSVPAPSIEMAVLAQKKQKMNWPPPYYKSDSIPSVEPPTPPISDDLPPPPPVPKPDDLFTFEERLDSLPLDAPPPPPIAVPEFEERLDSFPLDDPPPPPPVAKDAVLSYEPPPPPVAKPSDLRKERETHAAPKKKPGKLDMTAFERTLNQEKPPPPSNKPKIAGKPAAKVKDRAADLEGAIPTGPPPTVSPMKKQAPPKSGYVAMQLGQPAKGKTKPMGRALIPRPFTPAEITAARNKLISQGIYDENEAIDVEQIYEAMENGHLGELYESMEEMQAAPSLSQRPLPQQPSDAVYAVDEPVFPKSGAASGQQTKPTNAVVPRKDQMMGRKGKAKAKLPDPVPADEEYEITSPDERIPAVPPRVQPKNVQRPPVLEEYAVNPHMEPAPGLLPRKPLPPKKMERAKARPAPSDDVYEPVTIGLQQDDIYEPVEVVDDRPPSFSQYHNLPNVGPKPKEPDTVYRNLPGSRSQQQHPEGGYVRMQYKK